MKKVKLYQAERVDLPDIQNIFDFTEEEFQGWASAILAGTPLSGVPTSYILQGFTPDNISGLTMDIVVADSVLFNTAASTTALSGSTYKGDSSASPLSATLSDNTDNYIHINISRVSGDADLRVFWDRVANSGEGAEWSQVVNTTESLSASLDISVVGWSVDPDNIPLFKVTTAAGVITAIEDYRNLFFRLGKPGDAEFTNYLTSRVEPMSPVALTTPGVLDDPLAFTGADKEITSLKTWMDTVMTAIKEIKWGSGPNKWYQRAATHLDSSSDILADGGTWSWEVLPRLDNSGAGVFQHAAYTVLGGATANGEAFTDDGTAIGTFKVLAAGSAITTPGQALSIDSDGAGADPLVGVVRSITAAGADNIIEMDVGRLYFSADVTILLDGAIYENHIDFATQSPIVIENGDIAYSVLNRSATVDVVPVSVAATAYVSDPDNLIIVRRIGDTVYLGDAQLVLTDTGTGTLTNTVDINFYNYVGSAPGGAHAPDYNATIGLPNVAYIVNNADPITTACAKLDQTCQELAESMPPIGAMIPWLNYGVGAGAPVVLNTTYWKYCDGTNIGVGPLAAEDAPDMANRYCVGLGTEAGGDVGTAAWIAVATAIGAASHTLSLQHTHTTDIGHTHASALTASVPAHYHGKGSLNISSSGGHSHTITAHDSDGFTARVRTGDPDNTQSVVLTGGDHPHANASFAGYVGNTGGQNGDAAIACSMGGSITAVVSTKTSSNPVASMASTLIQPRSIRVRWIMRIQ